MLFSAWDDASWTPPSNWNRHFPVSRFVISSFPNRFTYRTQKSPETDSNPPAKAWTTSETRREGSCPQTVHVHGKNQHQTDENLVSHTYNWFTLLSLKIITVAAISRKIHSWRGSQSSREAAHQHFYKVLLEIFVDTCLFQIFRKDSILYCSRGFENASRTSGSSYFQHSERHFAPKTGTEYGYWTTGLHQ